MPPRTKNPEQEGDGSRKRKQPTKKQRVTEEASSAPPKFVKQAAEDRYKEIVTWKFTGERQVTLKPGDAPDFMHNISHRNWTRLADPSLQFDPEIVREFYANAWCSVSPDGDQLKYSVVQGVKVPFDRDTIEELLGNPHPNPKYEDHIDDYHHILNSEDGFDREAMFDFLCRPSARHLYSAASARLKRPHMTPNAQLMMQFMLSNLAPNTHVNDIVAPMCEFLYCCLREDLDVDAASRISDEILGNVVKTLDASERRKGKKHRLGFPALITDLCYGCGIEVENTTKIQGPIDARYVRDYCKPDVGLEEQEEAAGLEAQLPSGFEELYQRLSLQSAERDARIHARLDHQDAMMASLHRGLDFCYESSHRRQFVHPDEFRAYMQWPGDSPHQPEGAGNGGDDEGNPPLG